MESVNQNTGLNTLKIPYAVATICQMYLEQLEVCFNHIFDFKAGSTSINVGAMTTTKTLRKEDTRLTFISLTCHWAFIVDRIARNGADGEVFFSEGSLTRIYIAI